MSRIRLSSERKTATKDLNLGRVILFCEGKTEKFYFDYFASIIKNNKRNKFTDVEIVLESANGNAQSVLNYADRFMSEENNIYKYSNYEKFLVFDCDAPEDIQSVIISAKDYELLISNYLFEIWLLMHFEDVDKKLSRREIYRRLESYLNKSYKKGNRGVTREIIQNGNIEKAIETAKKVDEKSQKVKNCPILQVFRQP